MPLSLICACGARIELEDALAGQEIACPECQQPLKAPAVAQSQQIRTSGFALASLILAVTGAFTVVGTLSAVVLGLIAVVLILRQRDRLAGLGYAIAGITIGVIFTPLTIFAFSTKEPFAFAGYMRERNMAPFVDTTGPIEVVNQGWAISRPTEQWGVARNGQTADPLAELFLDKSRPDVLLVQIKQNAFLDVHEESDGNKTLDAFQREYIGEYQSLDENPFANANGKDDGLMRITNGQIHNVRNLEGKKPDNAPRDCAGREIEMDLQVAGQKWLMVVRIYHNPVTKKFYVLRAYAPRRWFPQNKSDIEKGLDSFRFMK